MDNQPGSQKSSIIPGSGKVNNWAASPSHLCYHFGTSGLSIAVATGVTHPLDVLKVRLQMQLVGQRGPLTGMVFGSTNIFVKIASGAFAGGFATALTNPVEVVKVRLQMNPNLRRGPIGELRRIVSEEGIRALWKGVGPAMARAASMTASQLSTYDESKRILIRWSPLEEGFHLHLLSSMVAGTVSTLITAPMDMIKTRLMLQRESKEVGNYKNGFHCAYQVLRTEGPRGLYKGGLAIFARLGPQTMITFILVEELRKLAGLDAI
ncbi:uncharacterized protein LOC112015258 isoform X5 [Quercus suber]|uniref:uncharacterized protein LOC112015258 isoform X5 n=1 Tax=Quercus suber TaxID=58331 RepID=UPI000CE25102|nr:mitochondrial substrate carrier family protein ucpB isoform X3 [Quercus suber]POE46472.1 mitochondrial substrate carrier family protein ucpb [Quercus suber]